MPEYWPGTVVNGNAFRSTVTFNRPNDTTPYAVGDVVGAAGAGGAVHQLASIGPANGLVQITSVRIRMSGAAVPSGMAGGFQVHLYSAAPANAADNAVFGATAGERSSYIGSVAIPTLELIGNGFLSRAVNYVGIPLQLVSTSLWAEIVTSPGNAFTPVAGATFDLIVLGVALSRQ